MAEVITMRKRPCPSCPYRRDAPSGLWNEAEYAKLPAYDGETGEQALAGALGTFHCHTDPDLLCAGWVACHDMAENFGLRFEAIATRTPVDPAVYDYQSPVPVFASGAEAAAHGMRDIDVETPHARRHRNALMRKWARGR